MKLRSPGLVLLLAAVFAFYFWTAATGGRSLAHFAGFHNLLKEAFPAGQLHLDPPRLQSPYGRTYGPKFGTRLDVLRHEPAEVSQSRIKRLQGLRRPQYRLRVDSIRVFYDISETTAEILAIIDKEHAAEWPAGAGEFS